MRQVPQENITSSVIRSAAKDNLGIPREVLNALKFGDKRILARFEDVYPTSLKDYLVELPEDTTVIGKCADEVIKAESDTSDQASSINPSKRKRKLEYSETVVLPKLIKGLPTKSREIAYETLKCAGYIRPVSEFY